MKKTRHDRTGIETRETTDRKRADATPRDAAGPPANEDLRPDRWIEEMLTKDYAVHEFAVQEAVRAIIVTVEETGTLIDFMGVLVDPWHRLRGGVLDAFVLRRAQNTNLRWVAIRPKGIEWADDPSTLDDFAEETRAEIAISAFVERNWSTDEALVIRIQRRGRTDVFLRGTISRVTDGWAVAPFTHEPKSEVEEMGVFAGPKLRSAVEGAPGIFSGRRPRGPCPF